MDQKRKSELSDNISLKDTAGRLKTVANDYMELFKEWLIDYGKVFMPIILLVCVFVTVFFALNARERVIAAEKEAQAALESIKSEVNEVKEVPFEENAYPEINQLLVNYYNALKGADVDALVSIQNNISNTEIIRLQAMSEYIDHYDNLIVYSKPGPYIDTYIVYAYTDVFLTEQQIATPGLQAFYICKDEERGYYINNGELSDEEAAYIFAVSNQADVIDLKNTVNVSYNKVLEENEDLNKYWAGISVEIDINVGEQLAEEAALEARLEAEKEAAEKGEEDEEDIDIPVVIVKVQTNSSCMIRKSPSKSSDALGSAPEGKIFDVIERMTNGWTKVDYNGTEAYIYTELLNDVETESADNAQTKGKVISNTLLNVRAEASATAAKLGVLNSGQTVDFIEEIGEWCKVKFNGQVGYVKTEYVTIK